MKLKKAEKCLAKKSWVTDSDGFVGIIVTIAEYDKTACVCWIVEPENTPLWTQWVQFATLKKVAVQDVEYMINRSLEHLHEFSQTLLLLKLLETDLKKIRKKKEKKLAKEANNG